MQLRLDLRMAEDWAEKYLGRDVGKPLSQGPGFPVVTRQVVLNADDPLVEEIRKKVLASERNGESLFCFVNPDFIYEKNELASAVLLRARPTVVIRTCGQRYGTEYDERNACPKCGFGRVQRSPIVLDPRYLKKKKKDFLVTLTADEWIVSAKLAALLREQQIKRNCRLEPVLDLHGKAMADWFQMKVESVFGTCVAPTKFGLDYFHPDDTKGEYVCSQHCLSGLNLISELHIKPQGRDAEWPGLAVTTNRIGRKAGWIVPAPLLLVTRRLADVFLHNKVSGIDFEVVHVV